MEPKFLRAEEVAQELSVSKPYAYKLIRQLNDDLDTLTLLAGEDYSDEALEALVEMIEDEFEDLEVDAQRGEQPLYPIVFSIE